MGGRANPTVMASRPKAGRRWTGEVLIRDHHEGYIDWAEYERNQAVLAANAYGRIAYGRIWGQKSGRGGRALLSGMLTCARCGRGLAVAYTGAPPGRPTYRCDRPNLMLGTAALSRLRRLARGHCDRNGDTAGGRANGHRGRVGGRADAHGRDAEGKAKPSAVVSPTSTCSRPSMTPRSPSAVTPPAIPTTD